jgi:hypothetical protein
MGPAVSLPPAFVLFDNISFAETLQYRISVTGLPSR